MPIPDEAELRARAAAARRLARTLDVSLLRRLPALGGDGAWRGPTAAAFQADARWAVGVLDAVVDELARAASTLERRADEAAASAAAAAAAAAASAAAAAATAATAATTAAATAEATTTTAAP
jgi:hypothetical protein